MSLQFSITEGTNTSESYKLEVIVAINVGFLLTVNVIVADNAAIHNESFTNWLWSRSHIFMLFLPAWTPEWNPIEKLWHTACMRMKDPQLCNVIKENCPNNCIGKTAEAVFRGFTHNNVEKNTVVVVIKIKSSYSL